MASQPASSLTRHTIKVHQQLIQQKTFLRFVSVQKRANGGDIEEVIMTMIAVSIEI